MSDEILKDEELDTIAGGTAAGLANLRQSVANRSNTALNRGAAAPPAANIITIARPTTGPGGRPMPPKPAR